MNCPPHHDKLRTLARHVYGGADLMQRLAGRVTSEKWRGELQATADALRDDAYEIEHTLWEYFMSHADDAMKQLIQRAKDDEAKLAAQATRIGELEGQLATGSDAAVDPATLAEADAFLASVAGDVTP